jgi:uncharacterized membrane protein
MKTRTTLILLLVVFLAALLAGLILYPRLPALVPSHWNMQGDVDGWTSRLGAVLLMPAIMIGTLLLLLVIPAIDPLKKNIAQFRGVYNGFLVVFTMFMLYIHALTLAAGLGSVFNMTQVILPAIGVFIYYTGVLLKQARRNFFIGIRTPWTLSSDTVWEKTHQLGSLLFKISGVLAILGILLPKYGFWLLMAPLLLSSLVAVVYSYFLFRRETIEKGV